MIPEMGEFRAFGRWFIAVRGPAGETAKGLTGPPTDKDWIALMAEHARQEALA